MYQLFVPAILATILSNHPAVAAIHPASCTVDHQPASITRPVPPNYPIMAQLQHVTGTSRIRIDLSDDGSLRGSYVALSSGNALLDQAAIQAAKEMIYAPETQSCKPISGSYALDVEFVG